MQVLPNIALQGRATESMLSQMIGKAPPSGSGLPRLRYLKFSHRVEVTAKDSTALLCFSRSFLANGTASKYGTKYIVIGGLGTPDGRNPRPIVKAVWIQDEGKEEVRFVTAYPGRS